MDIAQINKNLARDAEYNRRPEYIASQYEVMDRIDGWVTMMDRQDLYPGYNWWVSLTFRQDVSVDQAEVAARVFLNAINRKRFGQRYQKRGKNIVAVYSVGPGKVNNRIHIHMLIGDVECLDTTRFLRIWNNKYGIPKIQKYDPSKGSGAKRYIANHLRRGGEIYVVAPPQSISNRQQ